ncbi:MAG: hypothetical protein A2Y10_12850 [Planctomycetes bacterium GWF2_41_51]|nr:MAG: hypothetical protein A2Y10_12850 [Planctomycetes bacterium GWF2_41_51]HBG28239.1 hypothetical protein [Phycisphaerales bacterium]
MKKNMLIIICILMGYSALYAETTVYYNIDETSGTAINDGGDYQPAYNGTPGFYNGVSGQTGGFALGEAGKFGKAIRFTSTNGSSVGGWVLTNSAPVLGRNFTFSFWINATDRQSTTPNPWINSAWATYAVAASGAKVVIYSNTDAGVGTGLTARLYDYSSTDSIPCVTTKLATMGVNAESNVWHHVAAVVTDLADITLYVDGVQYLSGSATSGYGAGTNGMDGLKLGGRFGANGANNKYVNGLMDEFKIFNWAMTQEEITALYQTKISSPNPADGAIGVHVLNGTMLSWETDSSAVITSRTVRLATDLAMTNVLHTFTPGSNTVNVTGLNHGVDYYWRVDIAGTLNDQPFSVQGPVWQFTGSQCNIATDITGDCVVDFKDFAVIANNWLTSEYQQ